MLFPMLNILYFYISTSRSMCAVPNMAVFCSSLISCFPGTLFRYFLNDFEMVTVDSTITGITFCFYILHALYFHCKTFIIVIIIAAAAVAAAKIDAKVVRNLKRTLFVTARNGRN